MFKVTRNFSGVDASNKKLVNVSIAKMTQTLERGQFGIYSNQSFRS